MRTKNAIAGLGALLTAAALVGVGCGGGSKSSSSAASSASSAPSSAKAAAVVDARSTSLGSILVGRTGRTLYLFEKDTGSTSTCTGSCATQWPPLITTGKPTAGSGVKASLLGTTKRSGGTLQVTYNGHPLYYYSGDSSAGQTSGQGLKAFGAEWFVVSPSGSKVEKKGSSSGGSASGGSSSGKSSSGGGGGYGY